MELYKMIYPAENTAKVSFETKRGFVYLKALDYDKIPPGTLPEIVSFSIGNPFAEQWRKMLH